MSLTLIKALMILNAKKPPSEDSGFIPFVPGGGKGKGKSKGYSAAARAKALAVRKAKSKVAEAKAPKKLTKVSTSKKNKSKSLADLRTHLDRVQKRFDHQIDLGDNKNKARTSRLIDLMSRIKDRIIDHPDRPAERKKSAAKFKRSMDKTVRGMRTPQYD